MFAALLASFCFTGHRAQDESPGKIVFVSDRDGNKEIYSMRADGTNVKRLTNSLGEDVEPCWSPEGNRIAWATNRSGAWHIWTMNADGSNQKILTDSREHTDRNPMWSVSQPPRIGYVSNKRFYTIRFDGDGEGQLMNNPLRPDCQPAMSPLALRIAFRDENGHLLLKEGWEYLKLVPLSYGKNGIPAQIYHPCWSSDGVQIAFDSGGTTPKIFTVDLEDWQTDPVVMEGYGYDPAFAKGDTAVVFTGPTGVGAGTDIYIVDLDAAGRTRGLPKPTNLTNSPGNDNEPCYWEPKVED